MQIRLQLPGKSLVAVGLIKEERGALLSMRQLYCSLEHVVNTSQQFYKKAKQGGGFQPPWHCARKDLTCVRQTLIKVHYFSAEAWRRDATLEE